MACPLFFDYVRECAKEIGFMPNDTYRYCTNDTFPECPFYRTIKNVGVHCENIAKCPAFKYFGMGDVNKFVEIVNTYCLSENRVNCARYKVKSTGQTVPPNLLPDGTTMPGENK